MTDTGALRVVFGMPEEEYHAVEAFSSSAAKEMLVSPLDFWWQSWMNPVAEKDKASAARKYGSAFHKFLLEGAEAFNACYVAEPQQKDSPGSVRTASEMKVWLKDRGIKTVGGKDDLILRIRRVCEIRFKDEPEMMWENIKDGIIDGREVLLADAVADITARCNILRSNPAIKDSVAGGYPEVSVFWTVQSDSGPVPMKARFDYLNVSSGFVLDVKVFQNIQRRKLLDAVTRAISMYNYHLQAALYLEAFRELVIAAKNGSLSGDCPEGFVQDLKKIKTPRFAWLFVQNHDAPNALALEFREFDTHGGNGMTQNGYYARGQEAWQYAAHQFGKYMKHFGPDQPWLTENKPKPLRDEDLPLYIQDGMI